MIRKFFALAFTMVVAACASYTPAADIAASEVTLPEPSLEKIAEGVWIHKSYKHIEPWGLILSQGMVVKTDDKVFLIDTAWNDVDTEKLLALIVAKTGELPHAAIVTHAHEDKMGGISALKVAGVTTHAHLWSQEDAPSRGLIPADMWLWFSLAGVSGELSSKPSEDGTRQGTLFYFYPGAGHTRDNIVIYHDTAKVLFGGCLIRPGASDNLGNTADADIVNWADAVREVAAAFPEADIIVPSHGAMGGRELFDHTIALAEAAAKNE